MEDKEQLNSDPTSEWVTFYLESEKYAVNVIYVREVLKETKLSPVPGAPYFVLGIINLRGNIVTVIDTHKRLNLAPVENNDSTRIVVVEMDSQVVGLMVDQVDEVVVLRESEIEYAPNVGGDDSSRFVHGVSQREKELLILVDLERMLSLDEYK
ncbi:chemotaxis protein CheW [Ectothiorhodospiraceae bacterium BW-2]|nr:chemotaxis protein CheW [Ectothiorhodospiraceae bacterium BW-2]